MSHGAGAAVAKPTNLAAHLASVERAGRLGRRVGIVIYLIGLAYIVIVGFATIIKGIFHAPHDPSRGVAASVDCETARTGLATDLRHVSIAWMETGSSAENRADLARWDNSFDSIRARCDDPRTRELENVRHRVEIQLRRFERENGAAMRRLGAAPSASPSPESP